MVSNQSAWGNCMTAGNGYMHSDALLDIVPRAETKGELQTSELVADLMIPAMDLTVQGLRRALDRACSKQIPPSLEVTVPQGCFRVAQWPFSVTMTSGIF